MKNKEKYLKEILDIALEKGSSIAMKMNGELADCYEILCSECSFSKGKGITGCKENIRKWANSEYIEKPKISEKDRIFLDYIPVKYKWMIRSFLGDIIVCADKPIKQTFGWTFPGEHTSLPCDFQISFPMIKIEDNQPWLIEDLKDLNWSSDMGLTRTQQINAAINLLKQNGYIVKKDYSSYRGKWVAFYQEGMKPVLHGKIVDIKYNSCFVIKCKNGEYRYASKNDIVSIHNNKQECYMVKNQYNK